VTGSSPAPDGEAPPVVDWPAPVASTGPAPGLDFAPHGPRLVAYLIDSVLLTAILLVVILVPVGAVLALADPVPAGVGRPPDDPLLVGAFILAVVLMFVVVFGYFPYFWARGGQTPGMRPFRLVIVRDRDGGPISPGVAFLRMVGMYFVSAVFYLGFIWVFVDKRNRAWHDLIAGTLMVRRTEPEG
jgi:uncharacterized RDD family membrane protein YckC